MIASLTGAAYAALVTADPALGSSSVSLLEIVTAVALVTATALSFLFWYAASKPNVIVKPRLKSGYVTVVIANEGKAHAKDVRVTSESLPLDEDSAKTLDICLPAMYPKEEIEYFVAVSNHAVRHEPYEFDVSHKRWLFRWPRETRHFKVDFRQYENTLAEAHVTTPFENSLKDLARIGTTLVQMQVNKKDRFRVRKELAKRRVQKVRRWASSGFKRAKPDG